MTARPLLALLALLAAGCAHRPVTESEEMRAAVERALAERRLPPAALGIAGNILADATPPSGAPALLGALFADPLRAMDAAALWRDAAPPWLEAFFAPPPAAPPDFDTALAACLRSLEEAQRRLREAARPFDEAAVARALGEGNPLPLRLDEMQSVDVGGVRRAAQLFAEAIARFARELRSPGMAFPEPREFDSPIGRVVIGSRGNDRHGPGAALIVDPGGDDTYEREPAAGRVSVIVDLAGNDEYRGSDVAVRGLSALVDAQGNDRYRASGAGLGAAFAGASLLVDYAGDDVYEGRFFAEAAAVTGVGVLIDVAGNDRYTIQGFGEAYASTGALAVLWDRAGDDSYVASGQPDAWQRGGALSFAQGAAAGYRLPLGGGIAFLRDDGGDDRYEAQMFAQGTGYYYALGVLWDRAGRDSYRAVRYAQGNGVHQAVGVLRDEAGDDRYTLSVGVGQGMGLDIAPGLLVDLAGDDVYEAGWLAQGAATANGVGLLIDRAGDNRFVATTGDEHLWGTADWERRLPSVAALVRDGSRAAFQRAGKPAAPLPPRVVHSPAGEPTRCPAVAPASRPVPGGFVAALERVALRLPTGDPDAKTYGEVLRTLIDDPAAAMAQVPPADFDLLYALGETLQCALLAASDAEAAKASAALDRMLDVRPSPFLGVIAYALQRRPATPATMAKLRAALLASPRCGLQALAMASAPEDQARGALASGCWQLQAAAYERLEALGAARPEDSSRLPYITH